MKIDVQGVDVNTPIVDAEVGKEGKQSPTHYRFDLLDPDAMFVLTEILSTGEKKYGNDNWRKISTPNHINKALIHLFAWLGGNRQDDHLGHAFCRLMFALAVAIEKGEY